jgi:transcription antitermination protein NusB
LQPHPPKFLEHMINRRNIRVKALQVIYSFDIAGIKPSYPEITKSLKAKFNQTSIFLNYLVELTVEVAKYVEVYSNQKASKHLPTAADLVINIKLAGNEIIWALMENKSYNLSNKNNHIEAMVEAELVKKIFLKLVESPEYNKYINTESRTFAEDSKMMQYIFNQFILGDEDVESALHEQFQSFDDDIEMVHGLVIQVFEKPKNTNFLRLISPTKETYAIDLVNSYYDKHELILDLIKPKLNNWDSERVAKLDMIMLNMGISEMLFFETIPVKVTINEYIDIAKDYSTVQSGQFVNGILDNIHKDLLAQDKLHKVDFKKFN